ncbi:hypothetical protein ACZ90_05195 [Streptomyces albus subsp. albus]|nr:hypothetical protein ACZ90_05195 [Streptomyces albus subsp. albus]
MTRFPAFDLVSSVSSFARTGLPPDRGYRFLHLVGDLDHLVPREQHHPLEGLGLGDLQLGAVVDEFAFGAGHGAHALAHLVQQDRRMDRGSDPADAVGVGIELVAVPAGTESLLPPASFHELIRSV